MSLSRIVVFFITCLVAILLIGNCIVSVMHARSYFSNQMQALADDTASILGLSLSKASLNDDTVAMETHIDIIFDSGFYRSIIYDNVNGVPVITRILPIKIDGVPDWFTRLVAVPNVYGQAEVSSGWYQRGKVHVSPHPGYAYQQLWRLVNTQLTFAAIILVLAYIVGIYWLRLVLRPLQRVVAFSVQISKGDFSQSIGTFFATELNQLADSMNLLNRRLRGLVQGHIDRAEKLQRNLTRDSLTGLINRQEFDAQVGYWIADAPKNSPCALCLIKLEGIEQLNHRLGRAVADEWIMKSASALEKQALEWQPVWVARRSGSEFGVFIPGVFFSDLEKLCLSITERMKMTLQSVDLSIKTGAVYCNCDFSLPQILAAADNAQRQSSGQFGQCVLSLEPTKHMADIRPPSVWLLMLRDAIEKAAIQLEYQAIKDQSDDIIAMECLARIPETDGELVNAAMFWSLAERYSLAEDLDKIVVAKVIALIPQYPRVRWAVNLSSNSINSLEFSRWLAKQLNALAGTERSLCFEIDANCQHVCEDFLQAIRSTEASLALQNFGRSPNSLALLKKMPLSYVKLDQWFGNVIEADVGLRFYTESLIQIVHDCDVMIFASGLENEQQWQLFKSLNIDAGQGYVIAAPIRNM